ncbi:MAG: hypothetical protein DRP66_01280 [Planctomycetota bacterium]|nr:MAG: hypothetical protein DRP66_01280 [Planctomycetota bacterium]
MKSDHDLSAIIKAAVSGNKDAKKQLAVLITPRISTYIFRSTLDKNITEELLQEVHCKMLQSLNTLKNVDSFWGWLYRITSNCINSFYRTRSKKSRHFNLQDGILESVISEESSVERKLMNKELAHAVMEAVSTLKPRHRQVVTLRCFEALSFKEISRVEQTSEVYARVIFHRAIEKLRIALKKQGFSRASLVLALTMFARLTAPAKAASTAVTVKIAGITGAGTIKGLGLGAKVVKTTAIASVHHVKVAVAVAAMAGVITTAAMVGPFRSNIKSIHYVVQGVTPVVKRQVAPAKNPNARRSGRSSSSLSSSYSVVGDKANITYQTKGAYENKLVMPQGPDGAIMRFMQRWNMEQTNRLCSWLQDGGGNYYYNSGERKIYITNDPLRMLILPTDPPDFVKFIYSQVGYDSRHSYQRKFLTGLIKYSTDNRVPDYADYRCKYAYNTLEHADLSTTWPTTDNVEDLRDEMHKRGWTCFDVTGRINGKQVGGMGRIPFIYNAYRDHLPWLSVRIGDDLYVDYPGHVATADSEQGIVAYESETFFEGFPRPWQGIPCVDSIRRDAAKYRLRFNCRDEGGSAVVTIFVNTSAGHVKMVYDIDRDVDIVRSISFLKGETVVGQLYFDYKQDASQAEADKFNEPQTDFAAKAGKRPRNLWLATLVKNNI